MLQVEQGARARLIVYCLLLQAAQSEALESDGEGYHSAGLRHHRSAKEQHLAKRSGTGSKATREEVDRLLAQVSRDFEPWRESGISLEMVERAYCSEWVTESMRVQVLDGTVYVTPPDMVLQHRERTAWYQLAYLSQTYRLPDLDFMLYTSDFCPKEDMPYRSIDGKHDRCPRLAPLIATDKLPEQQQCVLAPDFTFGGWPEAFLPAWPITRGLLASAAEKSSWESRNDRLFWKGANTSEDRSIVATSKLLKESSMTNIHLFNWMGSREEFAETFVSLPQHCHHKFLVHMQGITYSSRLKYIMACAAVAFFPGMRHVEFWYHMLDETNHVAVEETTKENQGKPLLRAFEALHPDDNAAKRIGEAAQHLVSEVMHPDNIDRYWLEVFSQYSSLMQFTPQLHRDAMPLEALMLRPDKVLPVERRSCTVC